MRMAAHYGVTARELGDRLGSDELSEWLAFDAAYGFPDVYFLTGKLCCAAVAPWAEKPPHPADFVPYFEETRPRQSAAEMMAALMAAAPKAK